MYIRADATILEVLNRVSFRKSLKKTKSAMTTSQQPEFLPHGQDPAYDAILKVFEDLCLSRRYEKVLYIACTHNYFLINNKWRCRTTNSKKPTDKDEISPPSSYSNLNKYGLLKSRYELDTTNITPISWDLAYVCSELSTWVYDPSTLELWKDTPSNGIFWHYKYFVAATKTQVSQYALMQHTMLNKKLFLVFKGTSPELVFDMLCDTGIIPMPIWYVFFSNF